MLILAIFDYLGPHSKSIFSTYRQNFKKSLVSFLGEVVRNFVWNFEFSISSGLRGGSRFAGRHFPKTVILASYNFAGRPFIACYACFFVFFPFFLKLRFWFLVLRSISISYSLTNRRKTSIFDNFRLFWAFFGHFSLRSPKWLNLINSSFQGH